MIVIRDKVAKMNEQSDHLRDVFRSEGRRLTSQRRLILGVLEESETHLDAESLYDQVKVRDPDVSLATVYRTLTLFREMGLVEEHGLGEGHSHYEAARGKPHYHFVCSGCDQVIEFDTPWVMRIARELARLEGLQVTDAHLRLSGYCARCQARGGGEQENEEQVEDETGNLITSVQFR
jgi:Fe2+ or Zn2+ uptake regulation protein